MANDTRSSRKSKDDESNNSRNKAIIGKGSSTSGSATTDGFGLRRSTRETPSQKHVSSSPSTKRNEWLEKRTPTTTTPVKRKAEMVEEQGTPSPLRRSDRGKQHTSSSSSGSKKSDEGSGSSDVKRKKFKRENIVIQLIVEAGEISRREKQDPKSVGVKKKIMDGRTYKSLFKQQRRRDTVPDTDEELEKPDKLSQVDRSCCGGSVSKQVEDEDDERMIEELREECTEGVSEGCTERSNCRLRNFDVEALGNHGEVEVSCSSQKHSSREEPYKPSEGDDLNASKIGQRVEETLDDAGSLQVDCSAVEKLQTLELVGSSCMGRLLDGDIDEGTGDRVASPDYSMVMLSECNEGRSGVPAGSVSQLLPMSTASVTRALRTSHGFTSPFPSNGISLLPEVHMVESEEGIGLRDVQKSLHVLLKPEISKLCEILQLSEDVKVMVGKLLKYIIDNHHVNREPATILQAFEISLCWIAASLLKYKIDKKESLLLAKKNLNFGCTEEEANNVYSKLRLLKKMFLHHVANFDELESSKDSPSAAVDIMKERLDARMSQSVAFRQKNAKVEIEVRSKNQEFAADQLLLQQVRVPKHKIEDKEISKNIKLIQKKCEERMTKLIGKQQGEIQEFYRIWELGRVELEKQHRLDSILVRSIHSNIPVRLDKLKGLDDEFAKKRENHKHQKEMRIKDLEVKQLAERNEERRNAARWLEEMKSGAQAELSGELPLYGYKIGGTSEHRVHNGPENIASVSGCPVEEQSPNGEQASEVAPSDIPTTVASEAVGCGVTIETPTLPLRPSHETDAVDSMAKTSVAGFEKLSNSLSSADTPKNNVFTNQRSEEQILDGALSSAQEVPESDSNELVSGADSVEIINPDLESNREYNQRDDLDMSVLDASTNQNDAAGNSINGDSLSVKLSVVKTPLVQPVIAPAQSGMSPLNLALQDECSQLSTATGLHDIDAPVSGNRNVLQQVEVPPLHPTDVAPSDQTNHEAVVIEHAELLQLSPSTDSPVEWNQLNTGSASEVEQSCSEGHIASFFAEAPQQFENPAVPSNQVVLQPGENLAPPSLTHATDVPLGQNQPDLHLPIRNDHQPSSDGYTSIQNAEASSQLVEDTAGLPNQAAPGTHLGMHPPIDTFGGFGTHLPLHSPHLMASQMPAHPSYADPLQNELERLRKETDQTIKVYEDTKLRLKSDCLKEIEETIAEIRQKYEAILKDDEASFLLKKKELDTNRHKVLMNKILAQAFQSKCSDLKSSGTMGMQQVGPSNFLQQLHLLSSQAATRPSLFTGSSSVVPSAASQQTTAPPVQVVHHPSGLFSSMPTRPPHIVSITPPTGNLQVSEVRAPAPHLQPFRPFSSMSGISIASLPRGLPSQQEPRNLPTTSPSVPLVLSRPPPPTPPPPPPPPPPPTYHYGHYGRDVQPVFTGGLLGLQNSSLSAMGLLAAVDNQPGAQPPHILPPLSDFSSNFGAHPPNILPALPDFSSNFGALDRALGSEGDGERANLARSGVEATDIVCLSDDD